MISVPTLHIGADLLSAIQDILGYINFQTPLYIYISQFPFTIWTNLSPYLTPRDIHHVKEGSLRSDNVPYFLEPLKQGSRMCPPP